MGVGKSVLQEWVLQLPYMQQSVLMASVRGPDGIRKDHVAKLLLRWLRRCIMLSAFDGGSILNPIYTGGGSFTGPSLPPPPTSELLCVDSGFYNSHLWAPGMTALVRQYLSSVDELPHHFQLHFMHAAEILGYRYPDLEVRRWWNSVYLSLVNDMHLFPESAEDMNTRLGDSEAAWRAREEVVAQAPVDQRQIQLDC